MIELHKAADARVQKLAGVSYETLCQATSKALRDMFPPPEDANPCSPCGGPWVMELYDDVLIYEHEGKFWKMAYTYANGAATLAGSPTQVVRTYQEVAKSFDAASTAGADFVAKLGKPIAKMKLPASLPTQKKK